MKEGFVVFCLISLIPFVYSDHRIYGGYPIDISDAPYMVYVTYHEYSNATYGLDSLCGGTIISRQYILTAGHCEFVAI